ncbi:MAG: hypothetical protein ISS61_15355 [Desulfobacteraceae bacterium]|nr:hypothetical protein [Desulfobacteraceae bacterium]
MNPSFHDVDFERDPGIVALAELKAEAFQPNAATKDNVGVVERRNYATFAAKVYPLLKPLAGTPPGNELPNLYDFSQVTC